MTQPISTADGSVETYHLLGNLVRFLLRGRDAGDAYSLVEVTSAPGAGTPPHHQIEDDEAFYVLEGNYEFTRDGETIAGAPGSFVFVRRGQVHSFRNSGDGPARMLLVNSPGGYYENFFREAGDPVEAGSGFPPAVAPDMPRLLAASARYGIEYAEAAR